MFRQIVQDWHRENDSLTLTLRRDIGRNLPGLMMLVVIVSILAFLIALTSEGGFGIVSASLAVLIFSGFLFSCLVFGATTLRFDAAAVQIQTEWFRFRWPSWEDPFVLKTPRWIYDRKNLHVPVSRPVFLREEKELVPGPIWSHYVSRARIYRYEIRIPLSGRGGRGLICDLEHEQRMRELQAEIDRFWNEVPYDAGISLVDISCAEETLADALCSDAIEAEPMESFKDYSFNRGEDFAGHGEEAFDHGAEPPAPVKKPKPPKGERPIVTAREKFHQRRNEKSLLLVSERGGPVLRTLGRTSLWCYRLLQLAFFVGVIGIFVYWEHFEPVFIDGSDRLWGEVVTFLKTFDLPLEGEETMAAMMKRELDGDPLAFRIFFGLLFVLPAVVILAGFVDAALQIVRWPFWGRWKVRFRHSPRKPHLVTFDWRTDRRQSRSGRIHYVPFFLAIPATPKTHRMVTGRNFRDRNPGWRRPFQVVLVTPKGSFPLPVAGPEEQQRVIELLKEFTADVESHETF